MKRLLLSPQTQLEMAQLPIHISGFSYHIHGWKGPQLSLKYPVYQAYKFCNTDLDCGCLFDSLLVCNSVTSFM